MIETAWSEEPRTDRRRKKRRPQVRFTHRERMEFFFWYSSLRGIINRELRKKEVGSYIFKIKENNSDCVLPQDAVRQELRYIFLIDWKCSMGFNDIDHEIIMKDIR